MSVSGWYAVVLDERFQFLNLNVYLRWLSRVAAEAQQGLFFRASQLYYFITLKQTTELWFDGAGRTSVS